MASRHTRPPLKRRLILINAALLAGALAVGAATAWGIRSLRADVSSAASEYAELRLIEEAMYHTSLARRSLDSESVDLVQALTHARTAYERLKKFKGYQPTEEAAAAEHQHLEMTEEARASESLSALEADIGNRIARAETGDAASSVAMVDAAMRSLSRLAVLTDVVEARAATAELTVTTLMVVGVLAALLVAGVLAATIVCYRSVIAPLRLLQSGVHRVAGGQFAGRIPEAKTREFGELTDDFNDMAARLDALYHNLEEQVRQKSRELVRSERLASVGFLAAGVAHEINNPLGIVSGYAELAQRWLEDPRPDNLTEVSSALEVIRSETFRCKGITERLLSLARMGDSARTSVSVSALVTEVADMLRGLRKYQDRRLVIQFTREAAALVYGNADELRQVILNLLVNALDAVSPGGEVVVSGQRVDGKLRMVVKDNGCGMTSEVLERAFEPFFTSRPGVERGTGLGLAISHSIIESHGGELRAESDGPGLGSRFIVELPLSSERAEHGA